MRTDWALEDIFRLFEETGCPALGSNIKDFIETDVKENVKKILTDTGRIWLALPQKFPWLNNFDDSLVMAFTYNHYSKKYDISSLYPIVSIKEDDGNYFLTVIMDEKIREKEYIEMLNYNVDEMIAYLKSMIRKCAKLTKMIRRMNVKNCTKEWET